MDLTDSQVIIHDEGTYPLYRDERLHLLDSYKLIASRLKTIMRLNLPIILSRNSLNPPIILEIIPTKIDLLTKIHINLLINTKRIIYS